MANTRKDHRGRVLPSNVSQKADLAYVWRKMIDGKKYTIVDKNLNELKKKIIQRKADIQNGVFRVEADKTTLNQWFHKWIEVYKGNLKRRTKADYLESWRLYVENSKIGNMPLKTLKRINIVDIYKGLAERGLSINTINTVHVILYGCLGDAVEDEIIHTNPCEGAIKRISAKEPKKREALTVAQQRAFINFVANDEIAKIHLPLFAFFLGTGCRVGEVTGLTWHDVDFKKNIISINHSISYINIGDGMNFYIDTPKSKASIREIPLIAELREQLIIQKEINLKFGKPDIEIDGYSKFIFTSFKGKPLIDASINTNIRRIVNRYNKQEQEAAKKENRETLLLPTFSAHVLRHTFCTRFCENESNVKVIQKIMGHSRIDTTLNIYTHVTEEKANEVMHELGKKIKIC